MELSYSKKVVDKGKGTVYTVYEGDRVLYRVETQTPDMEPFLKRCGMVLRPEKKE